MILDTALDADLLAEGYARDVIRSVQDARKAADLDIADRISLALTVPADDVAKVEQFRDLIAHETLASSFEVKEAPSWPWRLLRREADAELRLFNWSETIAGIRYTVIQ